GEVVFCQPVREGEGKLDEPVGRWLRGHQLEPDPAADSRVWGLVRVSVRGGPAREEKPERP
ncbi:MAG: hypothetical protein GWO24_14940, partial [Akkermansiaceae bacterium]|nr:hypothetical protein [Akkermansiaceae bacterium]